MCIERLSADSRLVQLANAVETHIDCVGICHVNTRGMLSPQWERR